MTSRSEYTTQAPNRVRNVDNNDPDNDLQNNYKCPISVLMAFVCTLGVHNVTYQIM